MFICRLTPCWHNPCPICIPNKSAHRSEEGALCLTFCGDYRQRRWIKLILKFGVKKVTLLNFPLVRFYKLLPYLTLPYGIEFLLVFVSPSLPLVRFYKLLRNAL